MSFCQGFVVLATLCLSLFGCDQNRVSSSRENRNGVGPNGFEKTSPAPTTSHSPEGTLINPRPRSSDYIGCWGGLKGGAVEIDKSKFFNLSGSGSVSYKELGSRQVYTGTAILIELERSPEFSSLDRFNLLIFRNDRQSDDGAQFIDIYSYSTRDALEFGIEGDGRGDFTGWGEFASMKCPDQGK